MKGLYGFHLKLIDLEGEIRACQFIVVDYRFAQAFRGDQFGELLDENGKGLPFCVREGEVSSERPLVVSKKLIIELGIECLRTEGPAEHHGNKMSGQAEPVGRVYNLAVSSSAGANAKVK